MDKLEYQNKPRYLENHLVREPCKQRTACILIMSNDFYYFCIFSVFCFGHGHSSTTTTQVHSPFARKYGGLSLSVVRDTPEGTRVYHFDIGYEL